MSRRAESTASWRRGLHSWHGPMAYGKPDCSCSPPCDAPALTHTSVPPGVGDVLVAQHVRLDIVAGASRSSRLGGSSGTCSHRARLQWFESHALGTGRS